jgi:hypothetical protein
VILLSAIVVLLIYLLRFSTHEHIPGAPISFEAVVGLSPEVISPEGFLVAWGLLYLFISISSYWSEEFANAFATMVLVGDLLTNAIGVSGATTRIEEASRQQQQQTSNQQQQQGSVQHG